MDKFLVPDCQPEYLPGDVLPEDEIDRACAHADGMKELREVYRVPEKELLDSINAHWRKVGRAEGIMKAIHMVGDSLSHEQRLALWAEAAKEATS